MNEIFRKQVDMLLKVLPEFMQEEKIALKGGTAINMFFRDMPRLSVDIDLTYLPIKERVSSLNDIDELMEKISNVIESRLLLRCFIRRTKDTHIHQIQIDDGTVSIKAEINHMLRGAVFPCIKKELCHKAQNEFKVFIKAKCLSFEDLYAGKMCAALDRQHPRDLFDIYLLLNNESITNTLRKTFVVYLASHNRPISELINPSILDFHREYKEAFIGMTDSLIEYENLVRARTNLIDFIQKNLTNDERLFLLSIKMGEPRWNLVDLEGIDKMPAIQWKLLNILKMDSKKKAQSIEILLWRFESRPKC